MRLMAFHERFREARRAAGLSQDDIAEVCKNDDGEPLNKAAVSNWERAENLPTISNFISALHRIGPKHADANYILGLTNHRHQSAETEINTEHLMDVLVAIEHVLPRDMYKIPPNDMAALIRDLYEAVPEGRDLTSAKVIQFVDPVKQKFGGIHGRVSKTKGNKELDRRRIKKRRGKK